MKMNQHAHSPEHPASPKRHYLVFALNMVLSGVAMYLVMFSMIDGWHDFRNNVNMFYMALTMVAPMGVLMLATMGSMYSSKLANVSLYLALLAIFVAAFAATRLQAGVGDRQFIASMIPHHSGAILMCREAALRDEELVKLCRDIVAAQRREIEQMKAIQSRLESP